MNLTDEEIQIKVAEACGTMRWSYALPTKCIGANVPNYPEDLNACAEMEGTLKPEEWLSYWSFLEELACRPNNTPIIFATARQRSIAFLKTKGLIP
jgi:7,8-dihydro-6-hydroxymethylpterin-pyrophosphokinase